MTPESLGSLLSHFLQGSRAAVVIEDGAVAFDLADAKYSISGEYNKCLVHLWSAERNVVRRVLDAEMKGTMLRLQVQRLGQSRPTRLDICRDRDQRSPMARRAARAAYEPRLRRALEKNFPGWTVVRLTTGMDLEHSFGPAYLRGWIRQGQRALAVVGVNDQETQSTVDGALTCGILWLEHCRLAQQERLPELPVWVQPPEREPRQEPLEQPHWALCLERAPLRVSAASAGRWAWDAFRAASPAAYWDALVAEALRSHPPVRHQRSGRISAEFPDDPRHGRVYCAFRSPSARE